FTGDADFSKAKFIRNANFVWATFTGDADFSKAKFIRNANFARTTFTEKPIFERALGDKTCKARFSCKADPEDYNFKVSHNSPYKIETKEQEHNGIKFVIPEGAELFDPDEPSEQDNNDDN
uniref:pentapeptide repeat-containing protein n=2 Tax=Rothia TaxID=32207 RepID=UPI0028E92F6E